MFIVYGSKRTARKLGYVADFCPICRQPSAFSLSRIGLASHLYHVSFGAGKLVGHQIECCECKQALRTDPLRYASFEKLPPSDIHSLIQATFPRLKEAYAARLATEAIIKRSPGSLPKEDRAKLITEPFSLLNPSVEDRFTRDTQMDKQSGTGCLGSLIVLAVFLTIALNIRESAQGAVMVAGFTLFGIGTIYTIVQLGIGPRRYLRTKVVPLLGKALGPLKPTQQELESCIERCKQSEMKIGQKLKLEWLWEELQKQTGIP